MELFDGYCIQVVAAGWGRLQDNGNISTSLQKVNLNIFSQKACINMYEGYKVNFNLNLV